MNSVNSVNNINMIFLLHLLQHFLPSSTLFFIMIFFFNFQTLETLKGTSKLRYCINDKINRSKYAVMCALHDEVNEVLEDFL